MNIELIGVLIGTLIAGGLIVYLCIKQEKNNRSKISFIKNQASLMGRFYRLSLAQLFHIEVTNNMMPEALKRPEFAEKFKERNIETHGEMEYKLNILEVELKESLNQIDNL